MRYPKSAHVTINKRTFIVKMTADGAPAVLYERVEHAPGKPWGSLYNKPIWHVRYNVVPAKPTSVVRLALEAARALQS